VLEFVEIGEHARVLSAGCWVLSRGRARAQHSGLSTQHSGHQNGIALHAEWAWA
jgi:hypothetical protein